jgi:hypothetical protein
MALRIGGRRSTSPLMRPPLTTFSGELVGSAAAATREDAPRRGGGAGGVPPVGRRRRRPSGAGCSVRLSCSSPPPGAAPLRPPRRCAHATWPAPLRRAEGQSGPDQRREHHACGGLPPASPKPRRASGASRATATCLSSPPRSVASSTPPRPRRPTLLAPGAPRRSGRPPKIYSGRDILGELGALRSGAACWRRSSPRDHQLLGV